MTVVQRVIARYKARPGNRDKLIEVAKEGARLFPESIVIRHYLADFGPLWNTFVFEIEFGSYAEYEKEWQAWNELDEAADVLERWNELVEEITRELWEGLSARG